MTTELPLLLRIARGDARAVPLLLDRHGPLVWSIVRRQSSPEDAEDLVQEIFTEVWRLAGRFDPQRGSETAWITAIARRRLIDHRRRVGRRRESDELPEDVTDREQQLDLLEASDEARVASEALARLRPEQREVLQMALVEGLTHVQIAEATSLPLGTVKSHVRRGLERVRQLLQVERDEDAGRSRA